MQNLNTMELHVLSLASCSLIGGCLFPSLATSAGLAGLILMPISAEIIYHSFWKIVLPTTASLELALFISSLLISSHIYGQALFPALIAPFVGIGVIVAIGKGLESLDAGFNQLYNSISSCLNP
jgi:hypothetical protein